MKNKISDEELTRAAKLVGAAMRETLPDPDACKFEPSLDFQRKILRLKKKAKRKETISKYARNVAMAAVLTLCFTGIWLAVSPDARATVTSWVRDFYENTIVYYFDGGSQLEPFQECEIGYIPDGYRKVDEIETYTQKTIKYSNGENIIFVDWWQLSASGDLQVFTSEIENEPATVNGQLAEFIIPEDKTQTIDLFWTDDERGYGFLVSAYLDKEEIIKIAESISFVE